MNAETQFLCPDPAAGQPALYGFGPAETRYDGWTPDKQTMFLRTVSEGHSITFACRIVGMSTQSAYALRRAARGAGFALGWQAALILGRERLADEMLDRALNGVIETITSHDGKVTERRRQDNRLGMAMLSRMDRIADAARGEASHAAARLVAADFDQYLDLVGRDGGPARAGLFLGARAEAGEDELAPIRALARADKWLRTHTDLAGPVDTSDLDPAARGTWTGEQWARAEAAGLVQFAAPPAPEDSRDGNGQLRQPTALEPDPDEPVWWDDSLEEWRTRFPPPADFDDPEEGEFGDEDYSRPLTEAEEAAYEAEHRAQVAARAIVDGRARDRFFGFLTGEMSGEDAADDDAAGRDAPLPAAQAAAGADAVLAAPETAHGSEEPRDPPDDDR